jgi:4'-phosphopantetheinyl transferase EntD
VIERLLLAEMASAEAFDDAISAPLFPAEQAHVASSVPKRVNEFATARRCARQALATLGVAPAPILPGPRGAPICRTSLWAP